MRALSRRIGNGWIFLVYSAGAEGNETSCIVFPWADSDVDAGLRNDRDVGRYTGHCEHACGFSVTITNDRHEHLLVTGSTDRFVVISPPPTDGGRADDAASTQRPQQQTKRRDAPG